jgi:hypothetical protein
MELYDLDTRRLLAREHTEQLARDARPSRDRRRRHRLLHHLHDLLGPSAYRRRHAQHA